MKTHQPFVYLVGWTKLRIYYVGARYAKKCHPSDMGTTYITSSKFIKALWTYIKPDVIDTYEFDTKEEALDFEHKLQMHFDVLKNPYFKNKNIMGASFVPDKESRQRGAAKLKGRKHTIEARAKITRGNLGRVVSHETRKKISESEKGKIVSLETRQKISNANTGRKHSDEFRRKCSESQKGKVTSEATKKKISTANKGMKRTKSVCQRMSDIALSRPIKTCPFCGKESRLTSFEFHHINKCKYNK